MGKIAVYPGTFDPVTYGHLDIVKRSAKLFDEVVIGVLNNSAKTPLFSVDERVKILEKTTEDIPNVRVDQFNGLSVDFARKWGAVVIVRGLRLITDFEFELQMAQTNRKLAPEVDTTFLYTSLQYSYLSSTTVREVAGFGGDVSEFVPPYVAEQIHKKLGN
jgi:pantetheine-phosphate adenylyltransferase